MRAAEHVAELRRALETLEKSLDEVDAWGR